MKIKIDQKNESTFTDYERGVLAFFEAHEDFEKYVLRIRKVCKVSNDIGVNKIDEKKRLAIDRFALLLVGHYKNLSTNWYTTFANIIMTGSAIPPEKSPDDTIGLDFVDENEEDIPYRQELRIIIRKALSQNDIRAFLTNHWEEIQSHLMKLPTDKDFRTKDVQFRKEYNILAQQYGKLKKKNDIAELAKIETGKSIPESYGNYDYRGNYNTNFQKALNRMLEQDDEGKKILDKELEYFNERL